MSQVSGLALDLQDGISLSGGEAGVNESSFGLGS